ncbi:MAG: hypothetical protein ACLFVU_02080 [Phycisphaerae bacterium]
MTPTDHWNAAGRSALDEQGRRKFDGDSLFWRVENFDRGVSGDLRGVSGDLIRSATDHHLEHAQRTLHHWIELIRSEQRKRKNHRSGGSG